MMPGNKNGGSAKQWASAAVTSTTSSQAITLPSGQTGKPVVLRGSGTSSGQIALTYGNASQVIVPVNPNAEFTEIPIPASAFPAPTGSVTVDITVDGTGTIRALVGFA